MIAFSTNSTFNRLFKKDKFFLQVCILTFLIFIADLFFFNKSLGLSVPIFVLLTACCATVTTVSNRNLENNKLLFLIPIAAILPGIETYNLLTLFIGLTGLFIFVIILNNKIQSSFEEWLKTFVCFLDYAPLQFFKDMKTIKYKIVKRTCKENQLEDFLTSLILPILFSAGFIMLFAIANPLISQWFFDLKFNSTALFNGFYRIFFWLLLALAIWPLLRYSKKSVFRKNTSPNIQKKHSEIEEQSFLQEYLPPPAVTLSLLAFNVIFAIQTYLDFFYLWGNSQLPAGMTYADYVHKGAYTLIFTVFLAAIFILFVMNKNRENDLTKFTRFLILFWTFQNIILVLSTLMRMNLYVEAYALTYLRVSVLIWMLLVLIGLGLILFRIVFKRTNLWLIKTNMFSLFIVLYLTSFLNLPYIISDYNVDYAIKNAGNRIDVDYLMSLEENALPALIRIAPIYASRISPDLSYNHSFNVRNRRLKNHIIRSPSVLLNSETNWNVWSFRRYRLLNHLTVLQNKTE